MRHSAAELLLFGAFASMLTGAPILSWSDLQKLPAPPQGRHIAYGPKPDQFGVLRLPSGGAARNPVVVLIHGGCWRESIDLEHIGHMAAALTAEGYVTWSLEYRRADTAGGGWPGTFDDVLAGLDHLDQIAQGAPIDRARVVVVGHSAG